jgi:phosphoribosylaminoimidazolecarboxamide formyltransferase / IMP cyclohydrolase
MTIRDLKGLVEDKIPVNTVLISVFDKTGLDVFVRALVDMNKDVRLLSTGGTYSKIKEILGDSYRNNLLEVAEYTEFPEMEGGLVKTLHPKIHAGILGERNNPSHEGYLKDTLNNGVYIDMVVVNLYPFQSVVNSPGITFEKARGNIDIGGPTMIRAAAKNFLSCAAVCDVSQYSDVFEDIRQNDGSTTFDQRFHLAKKVFATTAEYDKAIAKYFADQVGSKPQEIRSSYKFRE